VSGRGRRCSAVTRGRGISPRRSGTRGRCLRLRDLSTTFAASHHGAGQRTACARRAHRALSGRCEDGTSTVPRESVGRRGQGDLFPLPIVAGVEHAEYPGDLEDARMGSRELLLSGFEDGPHAIPRRARLGDCREDGSPSVVLRAVAAGEEQQSSLAGHQETGMAGPGRILTAALHDGSGQPTAVRRATLPCAGE
jgi:hypothetical protein